jgi:hypothetical protein
MRTNIVPTAVLRSFWETRVKRTKAEKLHSELHESSGILGVNADINNVLC